MNLQPRIRPGAVLKKDRVTRGDGFDRLRKSCGVTDGEVVGHNRRGKEEGEKKGAVHYPHLRRQNMRQQGAFTKLQKLGIKPI